MKAMLFVPPGGYFAERWSHGRLMPGLGILYIAAVLEQHGTQVEVVPSHVLRLSWRQIARRIRSAQPDVVGITTTTENRFEAFHLAGVAKTAHPPAFVVMGGPHFCGTAQDALAHLPSVDGIVSGEGEQTMLELVTALEAGDGLEKVEGLAFRRGSDIVCNARRAQFVDLTQLPIPARHLVPWEAYNFKVEVPGKGLLPAANMMTSRGCPFNCTFCATPGNWGRTVRGRMPQQVLCEIEHLMERYMARVIWFYDDVFNYNARRTEAICDLVLARGLEIDWYCEIVAQTMTKPLLGKMAEAGLFSVGFGVEAGSDRIRKDIINKNLILRQAYDVIDWCNEFGVIANPFFIFSHPTETWEEAQQTSRIIDELADRAQCSVAISRIYPGTALERRAYEEEKLPPDFTWTRRRDNRIVVLPAAQGQAPLYISDNLSWAQVCELILRSPAAAKASSLLRRIPRVLGDIRSFADLRRYLTMLAAFLRLKLRAPRAPRAAGRRAC